MDKRDSHAFVNQLLVYTLVMICFSGSIGLGTVWMRNQIAQTANRIRLLEARTNEAERHLAETNTMVAAEQSSAVLEKRNQQWRLGLVVPTEPQVIRIDRNAEERLAAKRNAELFNDQPMLTPAKFVNLRGGR